MLAETVRLGKVSESTYIVSGNDDSRENVS